MRYSPEQKEITKKKIIDAAHRGFRRHGYDGLGVDSLTRDAGVTSGAFYKHFNSKTDVFEEAVKLGVGDFQTAVEAFQEKYGDNWLDAFARFYLGEKRCTELGDSCALQSLTPEVTRSSESIRSAYEAALLKVVESFTAGLPAAAQNTKTAQTWAYLALLIGGVTLARAVEDPALADEIAHSVHEAIASYGKS